MYKMPYRSEQEIDDVVKRFLQDLEIKEPPVDIELIAEKLGLRIVPIFSTVRGLKGHLSVNVSEIGINGRFFEDGKDNIYRFTVAHEIAHYILHKDFYLDFMGASYDDWCEFYAEHNHVIDRAERQADIFASFVLLPTDMIKKDVDHYSLIFQVLKTFSKNEEDLRNDKIEYEISRKYRVALKTAQIRLKHMLRLQK
ncbi:MAG: ImmA/IrrE family metallo-endopeptidase [Holosporaceae bacterium]|jgi:Zn-dependent peptidase ImmA (M78 family)|nr:ImmA/IrrE family metallo-endopeptidase [Holosporaceae bacterium]